MHLSLPDILRHIKMLAERGEDTVGMQPTNTLSCFFGRAEEKKNNTRGRLIATNDSFYGKNVVDDSICTGCTHYWNCRFYLRPFEVDEMPFKRNNDED
jgi:hypothetical protein